jgi:hypothetical protein
VSKCLNMRAMLTALDDGVAFLLLASLNVPIASVYVACDDLFSNSTIITAERQRTLVLSL